MRPVNGSGKGQGMFTLYDTSTPVTASKIRLLLAQLGKPYRWVELDILSNETRTPGFLAKNPNGRIPALELDDGTVLAESNAILWYLAEGSPFIPDDDCGARKFCNGCSSSSTATSPTSRLLASS